MVDRRRSVKRRSRKTIRKKRRLRKRSRRQKKFKMAEGGGESKGSSDRCVGYEDMPDELVKKIAELLLAEDLVRLLKVDRRHRQFFPKEKIEEAVWREHPFLTEEEKQEYRQWYLKELEGVKRDLSERISGTVKGWTPEQAQRSAIRFTGYARSDFLGLLL